MGVLIGAIVLDNADSFTFYTLMTVINLFASLFFLFLKPVPEHEAKTFKTASSLDTVASLKVAE